MKKSVFAVCILLVLATIALLEFRRRIPQDFITHDVEVPLENDGEARVLITGDTGTGSEAQLQVAALLEKLCTRHRPSAVLLTGDNFYNDGVDSVQDPQWQSKFYDVYSTPCLKNLPFYAVLGNHDYQGNPQAQIDRTRDETQWNMPARYYRVKFGNVFEMYAIDSNFPDMCGISQLCSVDWARTEILKSTVPWKGIMGHHPIVSGGKYPKLKVYPGWVLPKLVCDTKADFYVSGHDHNMQHLSDSSFGEGCEINQFVLGSGGGSLVPVTEIAQKTKFARSAVGGVLATFTARSATFAFFEPGTDSALYTFRTQK